MAQSDVDLVNAPPEEAEAQVETLFDLIGQVNIVPFLTEKLKKDLGRHVKKDYETDYESNKKRFKELDQYLEMLRQDKGPKSFPWPKSANTQMPVLKQVCIDFNATMYAALVREDNIVRVKVVGDDNGKVILPTGQQLSIEEFQQQVLNYQQMVATAQPEDIAAQERLAQVGQSIEAAQVINPGAKYARAERVAKHQNWSLMEEQEEWEGDTDQMLLMAPWAGCVFRKKWYDVQKGRICSTILLPGEFVINASCKDIRSAPRFTCPYDLHPHEIAEKILSGVFVKHDYRPSDGDNDTYDKKDHSYHDEKDRPVTYLEQFRRVDMDEDGYPEPYIVTVEKSSGTVVRMVACFDETSIQTTEGPNGSYISRVEPLQYVVKYGVIKNPDGSFYDIGFGDLLYHNTEVINSIMNRLLDAGTLATAGAGFIGSDMRSQKGKFEVRPGKFHHVNVPGAAVRNAVVQINFPEPSNVLFLLMGTLMDFGDKLAGQTGRLGMAPEMANAAPTTIMAMVENSLKGFKSIYRRMKKALKEEIAIDYRMTRLYGDPETYLQVLDDPDADFYADYDGENHDIIPAGSMDALVEMQQMAKAQYLMGFMNDPFMDPVELRRRILEYGNTNDIGDLMQIPEEPQPNPFAMIEQMKAQVSQFEAQIKAQETQIKAQELQIKAEKTQAEIAKIKAQTLVELTKADGNAQKVVDAQLQILKDLNQGGDDEQQYRTSEQRAVQGVAQAPGYEGGV